MPFDCNTTAFQTACLSIQGRLLRSLVHEISNPLQAVTGAVGLAREDLQRPADLLDDLDIMQKELHRVEVLLGTVRRLYRGASPAPLRQQFKEALLLARKELQWRNLALTVDWGEPAAQPPVHCPYLRLILLGLLQLVAAATPEDFPGPRVRAAVSAGEVLLSPAYPLPFAGLPPQELQTVQSLLPACRASLTWEADHPDGRILLRLREEEPT